MANASPAQQDSSADERSLGSQDTPDTTAPPAEQSSSLALSDGSPASAAPSVQITGSHHQPDAGTLTQEAFAARQTRSVVKNEEAGPRGSGSPDPRRQLTGSPQPSPRHGGAPTGDVPTPPSDVGTAKATLWILTNPSARVTPECPPDTTATRTQLRWHGSPWRQLRPSLRQAWT